jgi:hypothetical protein
VLTFEHTEKYKREKWNKCKWSTRAKKIRRFRLEDGSEKRSRNLWLEIIM